MNNQRKTDIDKIFDTICSNVKYHRGLTGLTQEKYAEALGVSTQYISQIERGESTPSLRMLLIICETFDYSVHQLIPQTRTETADNLDDKMTEKFNRLSAAQKEVILSFIDWYCEKH